jgi:hypothetical protein
MPSVERGRPSSRVIQNSAKTKTRIASDTALTICNRSSTEA